MQKKVDRRVRKTKSQLRAGLARLMQEKGWILTVRRSICITQIFPLCSERLKMT